MKKMDKDMDNQNYKTKDLYEAAFLYAIGSKLVRLDQEGHVYWFIFEDKAGCESASNSYWRGDVGVNAKDYSTAIKSLKDRLFAQR